MARERPATLRSEKALRQWALPFLDRKHELEAFSAFLQLDTKNYQTSRLVISGDSGSGKSFLAKEAVLREIAKSKHDVLCLYVDLSNDEFQSARLIYALVKISLAPAVASSDYPLSIPRSLTFKTFHKKVAMRQKLGWGVFSGLSRAAASFLGLGGAVGAALDALKLDGDDVDETLNSYLGWAARQAPVVLMVDNYQFMNTEIRYTLEAIVNNLPTGVRFIVIDRTIEGKSELAPPLPLLGPADAFIQVERFNEAQTRELVGFVVDLDPDALDRLAADIYRKTDGLPKDIEFCLREFMLQKDANPGRFDVLDLVSTIDRLPLMHRQFLLIAALLDGGIKPDTARQVVRRLRSADANNAVDKGLEELIALEYLKINSESGDRLRAGHERIVQATRKLINDELLDEVRSSLIEEFVAALNEPAPGESEAYLLHCLVGLQSAQELADNLHFLSRLIWTQYRQEQFAYLVSLVDLASGIVELLAQETVSLLLDALQKSSAFERGLQLLQALDAANAPGSEERDLYRYKFLIQLYQYDKAAKVAERLEKGDWAVLYRVNALLALERNEEARAATDAALQARETSEPLAVLLRNTVLLYPTAQALQHLERARTRFDQFNSPFRTATLETNAGLIHLCAGDLGEAGRLFELAEQKMSRLGSREIFQSLFNQAIRHGLNRKWILADQYFDRAAARVPAALLLDQVKISMARAVFAFTHGKICKGGAIHQTESDMARIVGVEMPYLRRTLSHNLAILKGDAHPTRLLKPEFLASAEQASLYLPVSWGEGPPLIVNPSIHWRY